MKKISIIFILAGLIGGSLTLYSTSKKKPDYYYWFNPSSGRFGLRSTVPTSGISFEWEKHSPFYDVLAMPGYPGHLLMESYPSDQSVRKYGLLLSFIFGGLFWGGISLIIWKLKSRPPLPKPAN